MSHHYSSPDGRGFPDGDARLDLTDLYAFPKPGDVDKSILIMDVHPSIGENPPGPTTTEPFASEALYELKIDTDGDAVADIAYRVRFSSEGGAQTATVRRAEGAQAAGTGDGGQVIVEGAPVSTGREARMTAAASIASSRAGAAIRSSSTGGASFLTTCSSPATITSPTRTCAASCWRYPTLPWAQSRWPVAPHASPGGRPGRRLGPGRARRAAPSTGHCLRSWWRGVRCLPRRGAGRRCPFPRRLRARSGALGWVYAGGSNGGRRDTATGGSIL
jgi:Domain of unknown function (DUF4331)